MIWRHVTAQLLAVTAETQPDPRLILVEAHHGTGQKIRACQDQLHAAPLVVNVVDGLASIICGGVSAGPSETIETVPSPALAMIA